WVLGEEEGLKHIKAAYDMGINAFDTANVYSNGLSEVILGKAIKKYNLPRDEIVVMTKLWGTVGKNTPDSLFWASSEEIASKRYTNQQGLSRKHIFESIKHSLERLQLDYVDLLQCKDPFPQAKKKFLTDELLQAIASTRTRQSEKRCKRCTTSSRLDTRGT
ncbi:hypothetical protein FRB90_009144, partial [Tulasnella sp. 427]